MSPYRRTSQASLDDIESKLQRMEKGFAPLVDRTKTCSKVSPEYKQFKKDAGKLYLKIKRADDFVRLIASLKKAEMQQKESALLKLFGYLGLVESIGTAMADFALVLLILNNRAFHIESRWTTPRIRHAISIKDFEAEKIQLGEKLGFLERNGLGFFAKMIKRTLRNRIAHLGFDIDDDGNISYKKGKRVKNINIDSEIKEFRHTIAAFKRFLLKSGMLKFMKKASLKE